MTTWACRVVGYSFYHASCANVPLYIVGLVHRSNRDFVGARTGVYELITPHVDAHMGRTWLICAEIDQIAFQQLRSHDWSTNGVLFISHTGEIDAMLVVNVVNKAGTVKPSRLAASPDIGSTDVLFCQ